MDCLFCKIAAGEIPCNKLYEDEDILAFHDISPQAPTHVLVIPKKHITSAAHMTRADEALAGKIFIKVTELADELGLENGYRIVVNTGEDGGQTVGHLHFHILGGRQMAWPPG